MPKKRSIPKVTYLPPKKVKAKTKKKPTVLSKIGKALKSQLTPNAERLAKRRKLQRTGTMKNIIKTRKK